MLRVALSGGIASGKTTVSDSFGDLGVPIIDADLLARQAVAPGSNGLQEIITRFGSGVTSSDGTLDRKHLRTLVFNDKIARTDLEAIIHPEVRRLTQNHLEEHRKSGSPYTLIVIPLLVETNQQNSYDRVIIVDVARETQLSRIIARDGSSAELAEKILASQVTREQRLLAADDVIHNECSKAELLVQVKNLHQKLTLLSRQKNEGSSA